MIHEWLVPYPDMARGVKLHVLGKMLVLAVAWRDFRSAKILASAVRGILAEEAEGA